MLELSFQKNNEEVIKHLISKETTSIGRANTNDVCLPDAEISRTHFTIHKIQDDYVLTDRSTNGTFVNGKRVVNHNLQLGDEIKIGKWMIYLLRSEVSKESKTEILRFHPTKVVEFNPKSNRLVYCKPFLEQIGKQNSKFFLDKKVTTIGSAQTNDIQILSDYVSNFHCRIEDREGVYLVKDLQSTNGTRLNGHRINEGELHENASIELGPIKLIFSLHNEAETLQESIQTNFEGIISQDSKMRKIFSLIQKISHANASILIHGETGTGKELVAHAIHKHSLRNKMPFVALNCSTFSKELIESELFGHERGAFTSAHQQRKGVFEQSHGGTLFLDEIGELPIELQPKLLRVLESGEFRRVGGNQNIQCDVRIIAATHRNLENEIRLGTFREDLYYRIAVVPIEIPPLRERKDDIEPLAHHFIHLSGQNKKYTLSDGAKQKLINHPFHGNVRELKNVMQRALIEAPLNIIDEEHILLSNVAGRDKTAFEFKNATTTFRQPKTLEDIEKEKIIAELNHFAFNKSKTAQALGIAKSTLFQKIKKYNIEDKGTDQEDD